MTTIHCALFLLISSVLSSAFDPQHSSGFEGWSDNCPYAFPHLQWYWYIASWIIRYSRVWNDQESVAVILGGMSKMSPLNVASSPNYIGLFIQTKQETKPLVFNLYPSSVHVNSSMAGFEFAAGISIAFTLLALFYRKCSNDIQQRLCVYSCLYDGSRSSIDC